VLKIPRQIQGTFRVLKQILKNLAASSAASKRRSLWTARGIRRGESGARHFDKMGRRDKASSRAKNSRNRRHSSESDPDYKEKVKRKGKLKRRDRIDIA
jgi:hypothetical protein